MAEILSVTHIQLAQPSPKGAIPLAAICLSKEKGKHFVHGSESDLVSETAIDRAVKEGQIAKLKKVICIGTDQQFFLMPTGTIVLANSIDGPNDIPAKELSLLKPKDERPLLRLADTGILQGIGLTVADLLDEEFPPEFNVSLHSLENYIERDPKRAIARCKSSILYCSKFRSPMEIDNGLKTLHDYVRDSVKDELTEQLLDHPHDSIEMLLRRWIDPLPTLLLFPLFWIDSLEPYWGWIPDPYGSDCVKKE